MHVEQPQMMVYGLDPTERKVALFLDSHPIVPECLLADVETWVHEFTETTMMRLLDEFVTDSMTAFSLFRLEEGRYWVYYTTMPHILASLSGFSLFDHKPIYEDGFWQMLQTSIPLKEFKRRRASNWWP